MTELQKFLNRINNLREKDKITVQDAKDLRELVRSMASKKGGLAPKEETRANNRINDAIERKKAASKPKPPPPPPPKPAPTATPAPAPSSPTAAPAPPASPGGNIDSGSDADDFVNYGDEEEPQPILPTAATPPTEPAKPLTINIPKPSKRAKSNIPDDAERIGMPDINRKVTEEVKRVTLSLINVTKNFIEGGVSFRGIDYIAENEILDEEGNPYYDLPDLNTTEGNSGMAEERIGDIKRVVDDILATGQKGDKYNYQRYLQLFNLSYTGTGDPVYKFSMDLSGTVLDDLTLSLVDEESDLE